LSKEATLYPVLHHTHPRDSPEPSSTAISSFLTVTNPCVACSGDTNPDTPMRNQAAAAWAVDIEQHELVQIPEDFEAGAVRYRSQRLRESCVILPWEIPGMISDELASYGYQGPDKFANTSIGKQYNSSNRISIYTIYNVHSDAASPEVR
jgi:hypothetical protein